MNRLTIDILLICTVIFLGFTLLFFGRAVTSKSLACQTNPLSYGGQAVENMLKSPLICSCNFGDMKIPTFRFNSTAIIPNDPNIDSRDFYVDLNMSNLNIYLENDKKQK